MKLKDYIITILLVVCIIVSSVALVKAKIIEGPVGATGSSGVKGDTGEQGEKGESGADGINGKNGTSIHSAEIKENGHLYLTLTDGRTIDAGSVGVAGADGKDGKDGTNGKDGKNGTNGTNGTNGKDGVSITNTKVINGYLWVYLSNGQSINAGYVKGADGKDGKDGKIEIITNELTTDVFTKYNVTFFETLPNDYFCKYDYLAIYLYNSNGYWYYYICNQNGAADGYALKLDTISKVYIHKSINWPDWMSEFDEGIYILKSANIYSGDLSGNCPCLYVSYESIMSISEFIKNAK